ncbi:uncharacterized protein LOC143879385 isoform X1 [Tasmannia lanceolata]|uniref:uncharacterized protein LOC143879385 isoform X1 n=1 Tax=Tasmannia lanceolata TaxID=3420 RepID=UPI004064528E
MASGLSESTSKTPRQRSSCLGCTNGSIFMYIHKNARRNLNMASGLSESASKTPRQRSSCLGCTNGSIFMYIHKNARSVKQYSSLTPTQDVPSGDHYHLMSIECFPKRHENVRFLANFLTEPGIIIKRSPGEHKTISNVLRDYLSSVVSVFVCADPH